MNDNIRQSARDLRQCADDIDAAIERGDHCSLAGALIRASVAIAAMLRPAWHERSKKGMN
jgi:hypothetical protein